MLDALIDPFRQGIGQRALIEVIVLGLACGPLGAWVLLYRQSYAAESIAHAMLPGLVVASLAGLPLTLGAGAGLVVAAVAIVFASRVARVGADVAVAVVVTAMLATGALLALSPDVPARLGELLFGDPLSVTSGEILVSALLTAGVLIALGARHRDLALAGFDPATAPSLGAAPGRVELTLLVLLAVTTLIAVQALGNLLVVAIVIAPGAAALRVASRLIAVLALSAGLAVLAGVGGLYLSHYVNVAAGAAIALVAIALFALSLPVGPHLGIVRGRRRSPVETIGARA
ncbi:MAG TPA: metal ABC transporter permease [Solirubrobacterales bacterium]|nr:metal ABC transporter permease [Solirubrobacterales bacterium]